MSAMPVMIIVLCVLAIAYRYYSAFLASHAAALDPHRITPAHQLNDGQNYHPTNKWVLFGHHFAAISGAGPLIGPVLAIQFGYLPGLVWIVVGVCLAGAAQDMLVMAASVRHNGRSLAEIARVQIAGWVGTLVGVTILFIVIIALAGLGIVVVKALGGEAAKLPTSTTVSFTATPDLPGLPVYDPHTNTSRVTIPATDQAPARLAFPDGRQRDYHEPLRLSWPGSASLSPAVAATPHPIPGPSLSGPSVASLPSGCVRHIKGSSWGTFTIAATIPIALFVGLYMYRLRPGRVVEASLLGGAATLGATVLGAAIPGSSLEWLFDLTQFQVTVAMAVYGFVASVLPVWLLLGPRDYLSSFLKIGTVAVLVLGVIVANPPLQAPPVNEVFASGGGPTFPQGGIFPFVFICVMCGAISGFHTLVASGTTPKMIDNENHIRPIGYGAMLIEGLVGITALIAAASLPIEDYYAINIDLDQVAKFEPKVRQILAANPHSLQHPGRLADIEQAVGEELHGRTGGAVTLAVGIAQIFDQALPFFGRLMSYWYHFAIMFEALFILTTIDAGTRIARFLLQENLGRLYAPFARTDWLPGSVFATAVVTFAWGYLIANGSITTIWPMFGMANQLLSVMALATVTTWMINSGRARYAWVAIMPMVFVISTTMTAGVQLLTTLNPGTFRSMIHTGQATGDTSLLIRGWLNATVTVLLMLSVAALLLVAGRSWWRAAWAPAAPSEQPTSPKA